MPADTTGFSRFNEAQILQAEKALTAWSDVANITFTRVGGSGYSNNASILFANYTNETGEGQSAFAYLPSPGGTAASNSERRSVSDTGRSAKAYGLQRRAMSS